MRRALFRFSAVNTSRVAPQATGSRASSRRSWRSCPYQINVVQGGEHGALFVVPASHQVKKIGGGFRVDGGKRFVENNQTRILQQQAGEQHALHLAAGKRADDALLESGQPDGCDGGFDRALILSLPIPPKNPFRRHNPIATMS